MGPRQLITSIRQALEAIGASVVFFQDVDYPGIWIVRARNPDVDVQIKENVRGRGSISGSPVTAENVQVFCRRGLHAPEAVDADAEAVMNVINRWRAASGAKCGAATAEYNPREPGGGPMVYGSPAHDEPVETAYQREIRAERTINPAEDVTLGQQRLAAKNPRVHAAMNQGRNQRFEFVFTDGSVTRGYVGRTGGWMPEYLLMHFRHSTGSSEFLRDRELRSITPIPAPRSRGRR